MHYIVGLLKLATKKDLDINKSVQNIAKQTRSAKYFGSLPRRVRRIAGYATILNKISIVNAILVDYDRAIADGEVFESWASTITSQTISNFVKARAETIYRTNLYSTYNYGFRERALELKDNFPQMEYSAVGDARTRPEHAAMDGIIRPVDDPFWDSNLPPNGFNCRCTIVSLTQRQAESRRQEQGFGGDQTTDSQLDTIRNKGVRQSQNREPIRGRDGKPVKGRPDTGFGQRAKDLDVKLRNRTEKAIDSLPRNLQKPFKDELNKLERRVDRWMTSNSDIFDDSI